MQCPYIHVAGARNVKVVEMYSFYAQVCVRPLPKSHHSRMLVL
jgi:hypothetical protein